MTVGELKAALEGKNDSDLVQVIPNYMINIMPAKQEPVNSSAPTDEPVQS